MTKLALTITVTTGCAVLCFLTGFFLGEQKGKEVGKARLEKALEEIDDRILIISQEEYEHLTTGVASYRSGSEESVFR